MPEISADGRTWTIRIKPGIYFTDDPAFKGKKRELAADDYVYAWKRLLDPRMRAPFLWFLDGKIAGADDVLAKAKEDGQLDYDAPIEGLKALDRYTLRITLKEPDYVLLGLHDADVDGGGRARGDRSLRRRVAAGRWRTRSAPARTGSANGGAGRRSCSKRIRIIASSTFPENGEPGDRDLIAKMKGKRLPQIGRIDISIIEESNPQLLAFNSGELDYVERARRPRRATCSTAHGNACSSPNTRSRASRCTASTQPALAYTLLQHGRSGRRRLHAGEDRAAPRDRSWASTREELIKVWWQGQALRRDAADSAGRRRPQPGLRRSASRTIRRRRRRCSTSSATSTATRTAGATCPTASRSADDGRRRRPAATASATSCGRRT